ncbi:aminoglycoside phosphotransferase family protein [Actinacidiphila bryophytorum]|uniref:Phosphotransferase enzyme family protein n=1 Tax=Actinacidiphila bryophytorum TaxID=1436133 RepID=A0A9W4E2U3_9ACTN|nr:aminoglycoside phosphotransferase family protein [Actinacidiphila bryophytorum]MBM9436483.1 aminoglycoside phosphotransferase family protein [Actinacidiphila bryophytorum]MBN6544515.1 aminoglycoside phosphotransferase family protein [Actinacidiphila bryophytorum]CAG7601096.1 Phosphotransferase enzyme family protein [Actinacidiphila bryophytorum]
MRLPFSDELRSALGKPRRARRLGSSPRSRVWSVELPAGAAVVKQIVGGADAGERYAREIAALRLALRAETPVVPALLATDPAARVMVLDRVAHRPPPPDWIVAYATALARLHASGGPDITGALPRWKGPDASDADAFLHLAHRLRVPVPPAAPAEIHALTARLAQAPGHALLHGDPCPGNDLHTADGVTFVDFEQASWGSGLVELAYLRIGFPTCWCVTAAPPPLLERAERAYFTTWYEATGTTAAAATAPDTDPSAEADLADACAGWLLRGDALVERAHRDGTDHLARLPEGNWSWGTVTARQRLAHRLSVVTDLPATRFPALQTLTAALDARLRALHPIPPVPSARPA